VEIQDIEKVVKNRAGLSEIQLVFEKDIVAAPKFTPTSYFLTGDLLLAAGAQAYTIPFTTNSAKFQENLITNKAAGDYSTHSILFKTPKDRPEVRHLLENLKNNRVAIIYKDWNGYEKLVRNLRCKAVVDTNTMGGYNGTNFSFTGQSKKAAGFLVSPFGVGIPAGISYWAIGSDFIVQ
jgi:hypothetical protein